MDYKRLFCPQPKSDKADRVKKLIVQIDRWTRSEDIKKLLVMFGGIPKFADVPDLESRLQGLVKFSEKWDFRSIQKEKVLTGEKEVARWLLMDDEFIKKNSEEILDAAENLGLINVREPLYDHYDYILALGGARFTNLHRCQMAALVAKEKQMNCKIIALGSMRPISDSERYAIDTYAPSASTEFDAMHAGMCIALNDGEDMLYTEEKHEDINVNISWNVRKYDLDYKGISECYLIAAPSSNPSRRANSADAYEFFFKHFHPKEGSRILLCTSSIYAPYQHVRFFEYDIEYNIQSDVVGVDRFITDAMVLSKPVNYLQEMRATLMSMNYFVGKYKDI